MKIINYLFVIAIVFLPLIAVSDPELDSLVSFGFREDWQLVHQGNAEIKDNYNDSANAILRGFIAMDEESDFGVYVWQTLDTINIDGIYKSKLQVWTTIDCGNTWEQKDFNINIDNFYMQTFNLYSDGNDKRTIYATLTSKAKRKHLFMKSSDDGISWDTTMIDSTYEVRKAVGVNGDYPNRFLRVDSNILFWGFYANIMKSTDGGDTWGNFSPPEYEDKYQVYSGTVAYSEKDSSLAIGGGTFDSSYKAECFILFSKDLGQTWDKLLLPMDINTVTVPFIEGLNFYVDENSWYGVKYDNENVVYTILKTTDHHKSIDTLLYFDYGAEYLVAPTSVNKIIDLYEDGKVILFSGSNRVFFLSKDYGETFEQILKPTDISSEFRAGFVGMNAVWTKDQNILVLLAPYNVILKYDPESSVTDDIPQFQTKLYPNPCPKNSKLFMSIENDKPRYATCKIYNIAGELIDSQDIDMPSGYHTIDYNTSKLNTGAYFFIVESENEVIAREKFIVE